MKVLITGANGFIGTNLCQELIENKYNVAGLVRKTSSIKYLKDKPVELRYGEITRKNTLKGLFKNIDVVIHLAATIEIDDIKKAFLINAVGTKNVIEQAIEEGVKKFIYVSSQAALGPSLWKQFKTEEDSPSPVSIYGYSKLAGEKEVLKRKGEISTIILRPPAIFGPGDRETLVLFKFLQQNFIPLTGNREKYFPFIYIKDFVKIIRFFIKWNEEKSAIFNVGGSRIYPYSSIFRLIGKIINKKLHRYPFPVTETLIFHLMPFLKKFLPPIVNKDKMREFYHCYWFMSSKKLNSLHNFQYTDIKEAFEKTIKWYKDEKWL